MRKAVVYLLILLVITACSHSKNPLVIIQTELGTIEVELYEKQAPVTVKNFLSYTDSGLFTNGVFYRTVRMNNQPHNDIKIEVIQGGLGWSDSIPRLPEIAHESTKQTGILHTHGIISMARNQPGTASSEFFICIGDQPALDYGGMRNPDGKGFAAFGKVINGMDVVENIHHQPDTGQFFIDPVKIVKIYRKD